MLAGLHYKFLLTRHMAPSHSDLDIKLSSGIQVVRTKYISREDLIAFVFPNQILRGRLVVRFVRFHDLFIVINNEVNAIIFFIFRPK
jgi:hypothetical protein